MLAGIVAMVVSPGPFDWWASMIGLTLLAVLWGYAHEPTSLPESVGLAAAIALSIIWTIGAPLELWFDARISGDGQNGDAVFVMWLVATAVTCVLLEVRRSRRGVAPMLEAVDGPPAVSADEKRGAGGATDRTLPDSTAVAAETDRREPAASTRKSAPTQHEHRSR